MMSDAGKVKIPALILVGEYDGLNPPEESEKVHNVLINSKLVVVKDAGHIIFFEKKEEVISLIDSYIN